MKKDCYLIDESLCFLGKKCIGLFTHSFLKILKLFLEQ